MTTAYRMLALMTGAQIGTAVVQQGLGSLSPTLLSEYALSKAQLGAAFTALSIGSAFFTVLAGLIVDRYGERPVVFWGGIAVGVSLLLAAAVPSYPWLVFWLFVFGVTYSSQTPAGGRAVLAWFDRNRGVAMSIRQAGVPFGAAIGGVLLPAIALHANYRWSLAAGAVIGTSLSLIAAIFYVEPPREAEQKRMRHLVRDMWRIARDPRTMLFTLACMVLVSAQTIMNAFFAVTAVSEARVSAAVAASAFAFAQLCAVGGRIAWGRLSDGVFRGDRALPLAAIAAIVAVDAFALAHVRAGGGAWLFALGGVLGFSAAGWNGVFSTAMAEIGGAELAGSILGLGLTFVFLASAMAPPAFGAIADHAGLAAAWTALALLAALGVIPPVLASKGRARHAA
ncbi:MAG: MFS transporter [Candidatus Velthaea sp.]